MSDGCPLCDAPISSGAASWQRCAACGAMVFPRRSAGVVLIVHEGELWAERIGAAINALGLSAVRLADGAVIERTMERHLPAALVLDVAATPTAFTVIDRWRAHPAGGAKPVILVASVYNSTAYKRRPTSLYGADDYVEQHHIDDKLPDKLAARLGIAPVTVSDRERATVQRRVHEHLLGGSARDVASLAQAIVADIALYHEHDIIRAAGGEIAQVLQAALREGERLLLELAPDAEGRPIDAAFRELLRELARRER